MAHERTQDVVYPERNYGICEAALLCGIDRKTLRNRVKNYPEVFPVTHDPITHRKRISGSIVILIRDNKY